MTGLLWIGGALLFSVALVLAIALTAAWWADHRIERERSRYRADVESSPYNPRHRRDAA